MHNKDEEIYQRSKKKPEQTSYEEAKKTLRNKTKAAKRACWKILCDEINDDIRGAGYKIAKKSSLGFPVGSQTSMEMLENIANHLFPEHAPVIFRCDKSAQFAPFSIDDLKVECFKGKNKKYQVLEESPLK